MSSWGCPHEHDGKCQKVNDLPCEPGMKGCVLFGRFVWGDQSKNARRWMGGSKPEKTRLLKSRPKKIDPYRSGS